MTHRVHVHPRGLVKIVLAAMLALLVSGCITGMRAKSLRHDAYYQYESGNNARALEIIRHGVDAAAWPGVSGSVMIETYDDAGLYYYLNQQPRAAFVHQAVAVLLSEIFTTPEPLRQAYRHRLKLALTACRELPVEAADIDRDVKVLLALPEVSGNILVQRYY